MDKKRQKALIEWCLIVIMLVIVLVTAYRIRVFISPGTEGKEKSPATVVLYESPMPLKDAGPAERENATEKGRDTSLMNCVDTEMTVNGRRCDVYDTNVNHTRKWVSSYFPPLSRTPIAYFDFEGTVEIAVTVPDISLDTVKISPMAYGIKPVIDVEAHTVTFSIDTPDAYTIQFNNTPERAMHIFANPLETSVPDPEDPSVIFIGPGEWNIDSIMPEKGQTVYLAGGAVVHGVINSSFNSDITVCGRGILDGSSYPGWQGETANIPLKFDHCSGVTIKDIIVLNPNAWACQAYDSSDGEIDNLKIVSARPNGDGISLQSCSDYKVSGGFIRSWDDSLVVKNYDKNTENLIFENMQLWTDFAQSMEVGYETNKGNNPDARISNVTFDGITVLNNFHKPVISVHNADDALVENITFQNITVEHEEVGSGDGEEMPYLIDLHITQNANWSTTRERGNIRNVLIKNVNFQSGTAQPSRIKGFDETHTIEGVTIEELYLFGEKIKAPESGQLMIDEATVKEVRFR